MGPAGPDLGRGCDDVSGGENDVKGPKVSGCRDRHQITASGLNMGTKQTMGGVTVVKRHGRTGSWVDFKDQRALQGIDHEIQAVKAHQACLAHQFQGEGGHGAPHVCLKVGEIHGPSKEKGGLACGEGLQGIEADDLQGVPIGKEKDGISRARQTPLIVITGSGLIMGRKAYTLAPFAATGLEQPGGRLPGALPAHIRIGDTESIQKREARLRVFELFEKVR